MKFALLEIKKRGDNKDYNGGFGTTFQIGSSLKAKLLSFVRSNLENFPTMSYAYIAAILKNYGHNISYHLNEIPMDSDVVLMHVSLIRNMEEKMYIKKMRNLGIKNIGVYGPLATVMPDLFEDADFIIQGEPEEAVMNIAKTNRIPYGKIKSIPIKDLDSLPFPDWSFFPIEKYSFSPTLPLKPFTFVLGSRGCPYACSYCPYKVFGDYRARKPEKIVEELKYLKEKYGIRAFYFRDPTFSIDEKRIRRLGELMIESQLNLKWGCETRLDLLNIPLLEILYKGGLRAIKVGIESLDCNLLKKYKRISSEIEHQEKIINFCKKKGIKVIAFYIIGLPTDTYESIQNTLRYSKKLNTSFANFSICTPIPGTPFFRELEEKIRDKNLNHYDNFHLVFEHDVLSIEEILKFQEQAITSYYFRLNYIIRYLIDKIKVK